MFDKCTLLSVYKCLAIVDRLIRLEGLLVGASIAEGQGIHHRRTYFFCAMCAPKPCMTPLSKKGRCSVMSEVCLDKHNVGSSTSGRHTHQPIKDHVQTFKNVWPRLVQRQTHAHPAQHTSSNISLAMQVRLPSLQEACKVKAKPKTVLLSGLQNKKTHQDDKMVQELNSTGSSALGSTVRFKSPRLVLQMLHQVQVAQDGTADVKTRSVNPLGEVKANINRATRGVKLDLGCRPAASQRDPASEACGWVIGICMLKQSFIQRKRAWKMTFQDFWRKLYLQSMLELPT